MFGLNLKKQFKKLFAIWTELAYGQIANNFFNRLQILIFMNVKSSENLNACEQFFLHMTFNSNV